MRKLTYDIFTKNGIFVNNVSSYSEMKNAKEKGYTVKEKLIEMKERLFFDCYKDNKLVKTVTLNKDRENAKKDGFEIRNRIEWIEVGA